MKKTMRKVRILHSDCLAPTLAQKTQGKLRFALEWFVHVLSAIRPNTFGTMLAVQCCNVAFEETKEIRPELLLALLPLHICHHQPIIP